MIHSQPQPAPLPNQPHVHCLEADADAQSKAPDIDDIKTLEEKLRSLFSEHGNVGTVHPSVSLETSLVMETTVVPGVPTTAVAPTKPLTSISTCIPPSSLPLGSTGLPVLTPLATSGQVITPVSYISASSSIGAAAGKAGTSPSKPPLSRVPVRNAASVGVFSSCRKQPSWAGSFLQSKIFIQEEASSFNVVLKGLHSGRFYVSQEVFFVPNGKKSPILFYALERCV